MLMLLRLLPALPKARRWVAQTIAAHQSSAVSVPSLNFKRLPEYFPASLLEVTRVAIVDQTPRPPLEQWGLSQQSIMDVVPSKAAGITLGDMYFVIRDRQSCESLHFHELIHILQWQQLGTDLFLALYGALMSQLGYRDSPLETMAYDLQRQFDDPARKSFDVSPLVKRRIDETVAGFKRQSMIHRLAVAMLCRSGLSA